MDYEPPLIMCKNATMKIEGFDGCHTLIVAYPKDALSKGWEYIESTNKWRCPKCAETVTMMLVEEIFRDCND